VEAGEDEDVARRARRAVLLVRLGVYGTLALIAVALLAARGHDAPPPLTALTGSTEQNARFILGMREDAPVYFDTVVRGRCTDGGTWETHWYPGDGDPDAFVRDGDHLRSVHEGPRRYGALASQAELTLDGRIAGDEVHGVITYRERFTPAFGAPFECAAADVRFSVPR
jgi:hypothetical protein